MSQPNIVLIMTDTQGANIVGCYGRTEMRTPNIDKLASEGTRFTRAHTTCPVCAPARAALLTGLYAHATGVWGNHLPLGNTLKTLGQRFQDNGYRTAYIGKWHLSGHDYFDTGICPAGWDDRYWYDGKRYLSDLSDAEITLWRAGLKSIKDLRQHKITAPFTWADRISDRAVEFLKKNATGKKPFLLTVSFDEPHGPYICPPEFVEPFLEYRYDIGPGAKDNLSGKPAHQHLWREHGQTPETKSAPDAAAMYFGCNSFVDYEIGRVLDAVASFAPENTMIIYTSDHGDMMGAHQLWSKGPCMYEEITRVPFIVRLPNNQRIGVHDDALVTHIDVLPTLLDLAGLSAPPALSGRSLMVRLQTGKEDGPERTAFMEFNRFEKDIDFSGFQPIRCWMAGDFKLVVNLLEEDELYDLRHDPAELQNLILSPNHAEIRDRMLDELLVCMNRSCDPFRGYQWERRPWRQKRALGWVGQRQQRLDDGYAPPALEYGTGKPGIQQKSSSVCSDTHILKNYADCYQKDLAEAVIPFWIKHSLDHECGGYFNCLDRDGTVYDTKKYLWMQCREVFMFARLYNEFDRRAEFLDAAKLGLNFIHAYAKDSNGRVYFSLTREGKPVAFQRKPYAALFYAMAMLEYYRATGDRSCFDEGIEMFRRIRDWIADPSLLDRPCFVGQPRVSNLANVMTLACLVLEVSRTNNDSTCADIMRTALRDVIRHYDPERRILLENIALDGKSLSGQPEGRFFNPGHSIEVAWFVLHLVQRLKEMTGEENASSQKMAFDVLEGSLEYGWDKEYGGIFYFMDIEGRPTIQLESEMKLWWPHTEALYALALASTMTKDQRWLKWLKKVHEYAYSHFVDKEFGEWFGYCDRQGRVVNTCKGGAYKCFFHVPRFLHMSIQVIKKHLAVAVLPLTGNIIQ